MGLHLHSKSTQFQQVRFLKIRKQRPSPDPTKEKRKRIKNRFVDTVTRHLLMFWDLNIRCLQSFKYDVLIPMKNQMAHKINKRTGF